MWHFARCGKWFLFAFYMLMSRTFYFTLDLSWEMHFLVASVKQPLPISPRHAAPPWLGGHVGTKKPVTERNVS